MINDDKPKYPYKKVETGALKSRKVEILESLPNPENALRSTLFTRFIKCGKPNCRCASGEGHENLYLSSYYRGHTFTDYVPKAYGEKVSVCIHSYEAITALLAELSEINLELFRRRELEI
jgi:hypothetical protein